MTDDSPSGTPEGPTEPNETLAATGPEVPGIAAGPDATIADGVPDAAVATGPDEPDATIADGVPDAAVATGPDEPDATIADGVPDAAVATGPDEPVAVAAAVPAAAVAGTDIGGPDATVHAIEHWLVERGVPHLVDSRSDSGLRDAWTRALPLLVAAYLLLGLNALDIENWSLARNLAAAAAVLAMLLAAWVLSNRLRGAASFDRPTKIDTPELALFLLGPAVPGLVFGQYRDALETIALGVILLLAIYLWSSYGVGALVRWGIRRSGGQLTGLGPLVARALPLLLLFNTFLFINAEVWQMAGTLDGPAYVIVVLLFFGLGATFVMSRVPGYIRAENHFESWSDIGDNLTGTPAVDVPLPGDGPTDDPLRPRQRFNIGLIVVFGQAIQITLVVVALTAFFVFFGYMAIGTDIIAGWTQVDDFRIVAETTFGDRTLVLTEPLIRVSIFLGAFSGMYFTVVLSTDDTYRTEFANDVGPEIHQILAVRAAYHVARGTHPAIEAPAT